MPHPAHPEISAVISARSAPRKAFDGPSRLHRALVAALMLGVAWPVLPAAAETGPGTSAPAPAATQTVADGTDIDQAATLIADRVEVTGPDTLTAEGNVEIHFRQNVLSATRVVYDKTTDKVQIEGPMRLVQPGQTGSVMVADSAELSSDLQNGILIGARMVMARELQLASNRVERRDGQTTTMTDVVASSCQVCASDPTPLWEIRARRITHTMDDHQLRFEDAQFRFMGVPLLWTPALRLPDPTVKRYQGLLRPEFRTTTSLGPGLKLPYFIPVGNSADVTLTPYLSSDYTRTMGMRYRQAFEAGTLSVEGALSRDSIDPGTNRGYIFANGAFALENGYNLGVQLRMVTDPSYLVDYDITDEDRLWSGVWIERVRPDQLTWMRAGNTHSIRDGESNATQPMGSADFVWERVIRPATIGGESTITWETHAHRRSSDLDYDTLADDDTVSDGRDTLRSSLSADWRRNWVLPQGIVASGLANLSLDTMLVRQDEVYSGSTVRGQPTLGVELRWPWANTSGDATNVIEPVAQLLWSPDYLKPIVDEDSLLTEFDEGNLFSFSRFPGGDMREQGTRANLGVTWTRIDAAGWSVGTTVGRVIRVDDLNQFPEDSGLDGTYSDWLLGTTFTAANGLTIANRALFDDNFDFAREELRVGYLQGRYSVAAGYIWMQANAAEGRPLDTSQLALETKWAWNDDWSSKIITRYDLTAQRAAKAGLGLEYANECMTVDLSLSRRYTSSTNVAPETSFGFAVQLAGFGAKTTTGNTTRVCRG